MHPTLHTPRLTLRPLTLEDAAALHPIYADPETMRYMPTPPHANVEVTRKQFEHEMTEEGSIHWAIYRKETEIPIGLVNYIGGAAIPGLGYILAREQWGNGYAPEACRAALDYGFDVLGYDRAELWINAENRASQRVADKLGFVMRGRLAQKYPHNNDHHIMYVYGMWAYDWQGTAPPSQSTRFFRAQTVLLAHNVQKTVAFYVEKLGFRVDFLYGEPPNHAGITRGDWSAQGVTFQIAQVPPEFELGDGAYTYIFVDAKIDVLHETWKAAGVEIVRAPQTYPWGMREFTIRDPNGYQLHIGTQA